MEPTPYGDHTSYSTRRRLQNIALNEQEQEEEDPDIVDDDQEAIAGDLTNDTMSTAESQAEKRRFWNMGYLDGYESTKELQLQQGFQEGYRDVFPSAQRLGELLGQLTIRLILLQQQPMESHPIPSRQPQQQQRQPSHLSSGKTTASGSSDDTTNNMMGPHSETLPPPPPPHDLIMELSRIRHEVIRRIRDVATGMDAGGNDEATDIPIITPHEEENGTTSTSVHSSTMLTAALRAIEQDLQHALKQVSTPGTTAM